MVYGNAGEDYHASVSYLSQWNPSTYFPEQVEEKIADKTEARFPGKTFDDLNENEKDLIRQEVFEVGTQTFDQSQFDIVLDSKAVHHYRSDYSQRTPSVTVQGWSDLDVADQDTVWRKAFDEFFNDGDLVFDLTDQEVFDLTGEPQVGAPNLGGYYSFQSYQDTSDSSLPVKGYLKPMELNSEGVWRRSVAQTDDIEITDTANFYVAGSKIVNGQPIDEFDSLKIEEYAIQNRKRPEGSAPVMSWSRDVSVTAESVKGATILDIEHSDPWKRLSRYELGDLVVYQGDLWESQIDANFNRKPGLEGNFLEKNPFRLPSGKRRLELRIKWC